MFMLKDSAPNGCNNLDSVFQGQPNKTPSEAISFHRLIKTYLINMLMHVVSYPVAHSDYNV